MGHLTPARLHAILHQSAMWALIMLCPYAARRGRKGMGATLSCTPVQGWSGSRKAGADPACSTPPLGALAVISRLHGT